MEKKNPESEDDGLRILMSGGDGGSRTRVQEHLFVVFYVRIRFVMFQNTERIPTKRLYFYLVSDYLFEKIGRLTLSVDDALTMIR